MLKLTSLWHGGIVALAALLVISAAAIQVSQNQPAIASNGTCQTGTTFINPGPGAIVTGDFDIELYVSPIAGGSASDDIEYVEFFTGNTNSIFISAGEETTTGVWEGTWDSEQFDNGPQTLSAKVFDDSDNIICTTGAINVLIDNDPATGAPNGILRLVRVQPTTLNWIGLTNFPGEFRVRALFETATGTVNVTQDTNFDWRLDGLSVGSLNGPTNRSFVDYFSGPQPGNARLIVTGQYLGEIDDLRYDIFIDPNSTSNFPELDDEEIADLEEVEADEVDETIEDEEQPTPAERLTSDPELRSCLVDVVGEDGYTAVVDGERRLTFRELDGADRCFAATRFIIPANVAPVEPAKIREIREDREVVRVEAVEQAERADSNEEGIVLSGVSLPNTTIVIYVFSEPLVLTTTTDASGNWTYVLEDPLAPGEHEVIVAVEDESTGETVRSEAFTFNVAQAASIETNPSGLSLTLDLSDPSQNSTIYYVSAVAAVMLVGVGMYMFVIRRQNHMEMDKNKDASSSDKDTK